MIKYVVSCNFVLKKCISKFNYSRSNQQATNSSTEYVTNPFYIISNVPGLALIKKFQLFSKHSR